MVTEIFSNFIKLEQESEERSLVYLYESLIDLKDSNDCDIFLESVKPELLTSDSIVHILNSMSWRKNLKNWDNFVSISEKRLLELVGEKETNVILRPMKLI